MNAVWQFIVNDLNANWKAYSAALVILGIAFVSCMPPVRPKSIDDWYDYFRHTLQTAIPAARAATPSQVHIQTTQTGPDSTKTEDSTYTAPSVPVAPVHPTTGLPVVLPLASPVDPAITLK